MDDSAIIDLLIEPASKNLGEFTVRRALPDKRRQRVGPFVFFDHMGPAEFPPGSGVNVRSHPHIGLATITYLFEGEILHRDSLGYVQPIRPGEINWMTAGRGIVHSEKVTPEIFASGQRLHGLQTWVALPLEHEETAPRFEHYSADTIPAVSLDGAEIRVVIGSAYGHSSPVQTASETIYIEGRIGAGATLDLPLADELAVYVIDGEIGLGGETISAGVLAVLVNGATAAISAKTQAHVMICGGATLEGKRTVWWNFVSSSRERLEQAKRDWRDGKFGSVPGETDFIPLPE
ncbi:MAG: pirin family protein [Gammaproteobacteria bacterium]|nr:pirin family protein [Gammaproteobacteria bacterium]MDH3372554.1 pirin family protein [Gammaproteobacteria bacterium]MDH3408300.1 pirin family protein [Gammaproteobacteria bacterium]